MSVKVHEPVCLDSAQDLYIWWDHFLGDQLKDEWASAGDAGGSATIVDAQTGGIVRIMTDTDANDAWRIDWGDIRGLLVTKQVTIEFRAKLASVADVEAWMALWNDGTHMIRFRFDDGAGNNWLIETDDGTGPTSADSGEIANTDYHIFRIEAFPTGEVHFYIDGDEVTNSPITADIPSEYLQPYLYLETLVGAPETMNIDYVVVRQER